MTHATGARVLIVDDEPGIVRAVQTNLGRHDYRVDTATTGGEGLEAYARLHPDLVLLDLGLPDMDGLEVLRSIRERASTPVVVLSARDAERDKVTALDLGADDYLTKPFGINELLARVRVALRHAARPTTGTEPVIRFGEIELDLERRRLTVSGEDVHLTPTEWDLVKLFVENPDKILTDRAIMRAVWGATYRAQAHSLHVYVGRLRKKLEAGPGARRHLVTEPGVGYRFVTDGLARELG
ncbi:MAG: response regulator transcription factor [Chloroflexi bacterium]|nr:response regulator transcription factor [Chloroflexota bacterium]